MLLHKISTSCGGYVRLVDVMGTDKSIAEAARVSFGDGTRSVSDDRTLIRYLMRHRHTTPFEMCEMKFIVRVPMDTWRQWIRHRTANVNEYSTRYSLAIDQIAKTKPTEWRLQSTDNKQGSNGLLSEADGRELSIREQELHEFSKAVYYDRIDAGIAREQARKDLPLSTFTEAYWKCDLHNIFNFLRLRMDAHAQKEIREYANVMSEFVKEVFPIAWEAFEDYQLHAVQLTRMEVEVLKNVSDHLQTHGEVPFLSTITAFTVQQFPDTRSREYKECLNKMKTLLSCQSNTEETTTKS